jgi:hypothetical protein
MLRFGVGILVIAGVALAFAVMRNGSSASAFGQGNCVIGKESDTSILATGCSGPHDARIVTVLSNATDTCPAGDSTFVTQPPDPPLCLDYSDHNP